MQENTFNITFRPALRPSGESTSEGRSWFAWLLEPEPPAVEPYAVTVVLSGGHPRRHADKDLLRTAFRTAAAHGGPVQVSCVGEVSGHLARHIDEIRAELDAVGLGHLLEVDCPVAGQATQAA